MIWYGAAYQRWLIPRDYQDMKLDFGLGHYDGRGWRGLHQDSSMSIAACAFRMPRASLPTSHSPEQNFIDRKCPPFAAILSRGAALRAQRHVDQPITTLCGSLYILRILLIRRLKQMSETTFPAYTTALADLGKQLILQVVLFRRISKLITAFGPTRHAARGA